MNTKYQARPSNTETEHFFATADEAVAFARKAVAATSAEYCTLERLVMTRDGWKASGERFGLPLAIDKNGSQDGSDEYEFYGEPSTW